MEDLYITISLVSAKISMGIRICVEPRRNNTYLRARDFMWDLSEIPGILLNHILASAEISKSAVSALSSISASEG